MPKIVDRDARRREVIAAVWRIIVRDGIEHASFREVAVEAGFAIGSIRHFFGSHEDLIVAAAQEMVDRVVDRMTVLVEKMPPDGSRELAYAVLEAILPLDDARRAESVLWVAVSGAARTNPALAEQSLAMHDGIRDVVRMVIAYTPYAGDEVEVERLSALLDGMAVAAVLQPDRLSANQMRSVLRRHMEIFLPAAERSGR